jgi:hypothetical protein
MQTATYYYRFLREIPIILAQFFKTFTPELLTTDLPYIEYSNR